MNNIVKDHATSVWPGDRELLACLDEVPNTVPPRQARLYSSCNVRLQIASFCSCGFLFVFHKRLVEMATAGHAVVHYRQLHHCEVSMNMRTGWRTAGELFAIIHCDIDVAFPENHPRSIRAKTECSIKTAIYTLMGNVLALSDRCYSNLAIWENPSRDGQNLLLIVPRGRVCLPRSNDADVKHRHVTSLEKSRQIARISSLCQRGLCKMHRNARMTEYCQYWISCHVQLWFKLRAEDIVVGLWEHAPVKRQEACSLYVPYSHYARWATSEKLAFPADRPSDALQSAKKYATRQNTVWWTLTVTSQRHATWRHNVTQARDDALF